MAGASFHPPRTSPLVPDPDPRPRSKVCGLLTKLSNEVWRPNIFPSPLETSVSTANVLEHPQTLRVQDTFGLEEHGTSRNQDRISFDRAESSRYTDASIIGDVDPVAKVIVDADWGDSLVDQDDGSTMNGGSVRASGPGFETTDEAQRQAVRIALDSPAVGGSKVASTLWHVAHPFFDMSFVDQTKEKRFQREVSRSKS